MAEPSTPEDIEKAVDAIYAYAAALIREGKTRRQVEDALVAKGIERKTAAVVVDKLLTAQAEAIAAPGEARFAPRAERGDGTGDMVIGGLICAVGLIITLATYSAASSGGGRYVIAWGAIVFGAIRFFRGLGRMNR